ncbi:hypothetical protein FPANT_4000 [Fusarium pseudoanthophilum]|uniref:Uncharacterized protein n=1 Tax=Fusarium pseudoanthophilum TaxID=48495 RepID=A0A8H5USR8_9HYPO|nr:hypothetical protein FPANT_4000 [Fusarium pseudoanthophilum]
MKGIRAVTIDDFSCCSEELGIETTDAMQFLFDNEWLQFRTAATIHFTSRTLNKQRTWTFSMAFQALSSRSFAKSISLSGVMILQYYKHRRTSYIYLFSNNSKMRFEDAQQWAKKRGDKKSTQDRPSSPAYNAEPPVHTAGPPVFLLNDQSLTETF